MKKILFVFMSLITYEDELLSLAAGPVNLAKEFDRIQFLINTQFKPMLDEFDRGLQLESKNALEDGLLQEPWQDVS